MASHASFLFMASRSTATGMPQKECCENLNFADGMPVQRGNFDDRGVSDLIRLFPHNPPRVFIAAQSSKPRMSQVPVRRPFLKIRFAQLRHDLLRS